MNKPQCSHSKVVKITLDHPGGFNSEHWECPDCQTLFYPESYDQHRKVLRDKFAAKALQINDASGFDFETRAQWAYKMADAMLLERNKETK